MARARNIKPGFLTNDVLAECEPLARILFAGLWMHADRAGRLVDRPKRLKAEILPYDECDIESLLGQLAKRRFILRYEVAGERYIQIIEFSKHQNPHVKESPSSIPEPTISEPAPDRNSASTVQAEEIPERAGLIPDSLIPHTDSLNPITPPATPGAAAPQSRKAAKTRSGDWTEEFAQFWAIYPRRPGDSRADAHKAFVARIADGAVPDQIIEGARRYAAFVAAERTEPKFYKQASTFLGPGKHYESDWSVQARASPAGGNGLGKAGSATARNAELWLAGEGQ